MHRLVVLYPHPEDPQHFRNYYTSTHIPLATQLPGLKQMHYSLDVQGLEGQSPYFCIWEADFKDAQAMVNALQSPQGQAIAGDVPNYASGGAILLHYESRE